MAEPNAPPEPASTLPRGSATALRDVLKGLPPAHRDVLRLIALMEPGVAGASLLKAASRAELRDERGQPLTMPKVTEWLDGWTRAGFLRPGKDANIVGCRPEVSELLLSEAAPQMLGRLFTAGVEPPSGAKASRAHLARRLRKELYAREHRAFGSTLLRLAEWTRDSVFADAIGDAPTLETLRLVPDAHRGRLFDEYVEQRVLELCPVHWTALGLVETRPLKGPAESAALWAALARALSDAPGEALALLEGLESPAALATRAAVELLGARPGPARRFAQRAQQAYPCAAAQGRPAPTLLAAPGGPLAVLALLTGEPEEQSLGVAVACDAPEKRAGHRLPATQDALQELAAALGARPPTAGLGLQRVPLDVALARLLRGLALCWTELRRETPWRHGADLARDALERAARGGYALLARELDALESVVAKGPAAASGSVLLALRRGREPWEDELDALQALADAIGPTTTGTGSARVDAARPERVVWDVSVQEGRLRLDGRVQTGGERGWSVGRTVGLEALSKLPEKGPLPPEDARIFEKLLPPGRVPPDWRPQGLRWARDVALALVGHPRVFSAKTGEALAVEQGTPELHVLRQPDGLKLEVFPQGMLTTEVHCVAEPGRLVVFNPTAEHTRIARAVARVPLIPANQEARVRRAVAGLATTLRLASDIAVSTDAAAPVDADGRLHVLLWRATSGLRVRLVVQPLGREGTAVHPGAGAAILTAEVEGRRVQARRALAEEARELAEVVAACPTLALAEVLGPEYRLPSLVDCYELLTEFHRLGERIVVHWPDGQPLTLVGEQDTPSLRVRVTTTGDWFGADASLEVAPGEVLSMRELLRLFATAKGRFVELGGDRILALTESVRAKLERLGQLGSLGKKSGRVEIHPLAAPSLAAWLDGLEVKHVASAGVSRALDERLRRVEEAGALNPRPPRGLQTELRDYQLEGYRWMSRLAHWGGGPLLCDDMGLGKTIQLLALLLERAPGGPALLVAPTSVAAHWVEQCERFAPALRVVRFGAGERARQLAELGPGDVLLMTYGLLQRESDALSATTFHTAVLDEAQAIKNADSQRARAAHALDARLRVASTGTPVENHLGELWSLMHFANPGLLGNAKHFTERFARPIAEHGDRRAADALRQLTRPFILRRTKGQVLDELPEKTEITLTVELGPEEAALYEAIRQQASAEFLKAGPPGTRRMEILTVLTRLRQAACHPRLLGRDFPMESAKHEALFALVEELRDSGHRALVFSQFVAHLDLVREGLERRGVSYQYLDGSTPAAERGRRVEAFQRGDGDLFLISLRAGGTGLNLTAADYVIHLDPWWNPAVEAQASDRAHRIGQTRPVTVYRLVATGTVEERILALHGKKRATAEDLLDGTSSGASVDLETLVHLLR